MVRFDLTDFSDGVHFLKNEQAIPIASHEDIQDQLETAQSPARVDKEIIDDNTVLINGHRVKKRTNSGKPISSETGLLKEIYSSNPQINPLPDDVVENNIKKGII